MDKPEIIKYLESKMQFMINKKIHTCDLKLTQYEVKILLKELKK